MPRPQLRRLQDPGDIRRIQGSTHGFAAIPIDHAQCFRMQAARRVDDVRNQRLAGKGMQHFGQVRMHPLSLPGRQNDNIHRFNSTLHEAVAAQ